MSLISIGSLPLIRINYCFKVIFYYLHFKAFLQNIQLIQRAFFWLKLLVVTNGCKVKLRIKDPMLRGTDLKSVPAALSLLVHIRRSLGVFICVDLNLWLFLFVADCIVEVIQDIDLVLYSVLTTTKIGELQI